MSLTSLLFGKRQTSEEFFLSTRAPIRSIPHHLKTITKRRIQGNHIFLEAGEGRPVIFCHGLFGGIFNADIVCKEISKKFRFIMPYQPMYDMPLAGSNISMLGNYLESFIDDMNLNNSVVIGSSMGGGAALQYALKPNNKLKAIVLCGSSGLSNIPLSKGFFKRKDFAYVKESIRDIFFDRTIPGDEMAEDVFNAIQSNELAIRAIRLTKSATINTMHSTLSQIHVPTLLVWGKQDPITPVEVAPKFKELIKNAQLFIIDECGHVPTQEKPFQFLEHFYDFMKQLNHY